MSKDGAEHVTEATLKTKNFIKSNIFDVLAALLIVSMFFLGLGALGLVDLTWRSLLDAIIGFVPFYVSMQLLNINYYTKGVFKGKSTELYTTAIDDYSSVANSLTGQQQDSIYEFCEYYNAKALEQLQTSILKRVSISYDLFVNGNKDVTPLILMTKKELLSHYNKDIVKVIMKAKRAHVKGISANILLSNVQSIDNTDIGKNEKEMRNTRLGIGAVVSFITMILLCLITLKDIQQWGWLIAAFVLFKMMFVLVRAYIEYFNAYTDITVGLVNHLARKSDILKQFIYWHNNKYGDSENNTQNISNISE